MKWCAGLGVRVWAKGIVVRIDGAYSTEGVGVQMMIAQPFQFYPALWGHLLKSVANPLLFL
jgi:hypothetical protein